MGLLNGEVAVVTGAAQGIGPAVARTFVTHGAPVVSADVASAGAEVAAEPGAAWQRCDGWGM